MKQIERFADVVIVISAIVLAGSYFLPVEMGWAPVDSWRGYAVGGGFVAGWDVIAMEMWSNVAALVILLAMAIRKWGGLCIGILAVFMWAAIVSVSVYMARYARLPEMSAAGLWWGTTAAVIVSGVIVVALSIKRLSSEGAIWTMLIVLSVAALVFQAGSVAFCLIEDRLLLNVGSVTSVSSACLLAAGITVRRLTLGTAASSRACRQRQECNEIPVNQA